MRTLLAVTLLLAAGCSKGSLGRCNTDSDCAAGATCDPGQKVCTAGVNDCVPACAAGLTCQSAACVDLAGPDIQIPTDSQPYARLLADGGADVIRLPITIADSSGVCATGACSPKMTVASSTVAFASKQGDVFFFDLDATKAAAGAEGNLSFTVTAQDNAGHQSRASGSRFVDDKPPVVTFKVFRDGDPEPAADAGFPPAVVNTGHDGTTFVYSDVVHVKGSVADNGGLGDVTWRIDGVALDGGVSTGTAHAPCDGGTVCEFDVQVPLNGSGNGELHTTTADLVTSANLHATNGATKIPVADLHVILSAVDRVQGGAHEPLAQKTVRDVAARTTRFLWLRNLPTGNSVRGLSVHPNGDVIATTIGAGDGTSAPVYVATTDGGVFALSPSGVSVWSTIGLQELWTAPAVVSVSSGEAVVIPSAPNVASDSKVFTVGLSNGSVFVLDAGVDDIDLFSAPLVLDGGVYFGTQTSFYRLDLASGRLSTPVNVGGEIWSPVTDGGVVYATTTAATATLSTLDQTPSLVVSPAPILATAVDHDLIVDMNGRVIASTDTSRLVSINTTNGSLVDVGLSTDFTGRDGRTPLQGSDGTFYVPLTAGFLIAFKDGVTSWTLDPNGTISHAAAMDCSGRLFFASNETVYALVTDDRGLADAPWPTYRRDSRATGNFGAPKYGIRLPGPDGGVCNN